MSAPSNGDWDHMFQAFAVLSAILFFEYFMCLIYGANNTNHPEEDAMLGLDMTLPPDIKRRERIVANNLENIPLHFGVFWAAFCVQNYSNLSGHGHKETRALTVLYTIYAALRVMFVLFYAFAIQPFRSISFLLSQLCVFGAAILLIIGAFNVDTSKIYV